MLREISQTNFKLRMLIKQVNIWNLKKNLDFYPDVFIR